MVLRIRKNKFVRKSKYVRKVQLPAIVRSYGGKTLTRLLSYTMPFTTAANGLYNTSDSLNTLIRLSNDWNLLRDAYELFNITKVTLILNFIPGTFDHTNGIYGCIYTSKDAVPMGDINQVADHDKHLLSSMHTIGFTKKFTFKVKANSNVPLSTADATAALTTFGWVKQRLQPALVTGGVARNFAYGTYRFTCHFSALS